MLVKCWPFLFYFLTFIVQFHLITCEDDRKILFSFSWSLADFWPQTWWPTEDNDVRSTLYEENNENGPGSLNDIERPDYGHNLLKNNGIAKVIGNREHVDIEDDRPIWGDSTDDKNSPQNTTDKRETGNNHQISSKDKHDGNNQNSNENRDNISVTEYKETEKDIIVQITRGIGERDISYSGDIIDGTYYTRSSTGYELEEIFDCNDPNRPNRTDLPCFGPTDIEVVTSPNPVVKPNSSLAKPEYDVIDWEAITEKIIEPISLWPLDDVAETKSLSYCLYRCKYPYQIPYVHGGVDALLHEFPHMATLGYGSDEDRGKLSSWNTCGATLISEKFVLTAAHCTDSSLGPPTVVRIGEHDLSRQDEGADPKDYQVIKVIVHPDYVVDHSSLYNDIALLQLAKSVKFTKHLRPACLHNGNLSTEIKTAVATGWGNTGFADAPSDILQKVTLDLISNEECKKYVRPGPYIPAGIIESQMCAGVLTGGKDTCVGDSGGPLQVDNTVFHYSRVCPMEIIGITSFGTFCGQARSPGVYTRVAPFVPWIESIVWPEMYLGKVSKRGSK